MDIAACRENLRQREESHYQVRERRRLAAREAIVAAVQSVLPHYPTVKRVYLFGSVTCAGAFHSNSDIDVAVEGVTTSDYFVLWRDLEEAVSDWMIDLRELNETSYFSQRVRRQGELVYERKDPAPEG